MGEMAEKRTRVPVLKIRSKCASEADLTVQFRKDLDPKGIFIKTRQGLPVGTQLRFEYLLADGQPVIGGAGRVVWARGESGEQGPAGMAVAVDSVFHGESLLARAVQERRGAPSRFQRGPHPSMRPTAPPPELEFARVSLPPGEEITSIGPAPTASDAPPAVAELPTPTALDAPISNAPPAEPAAPPDTGLGDMPRELGTGLFDGVGPVEQKVAQEYLSEDLSDSFSAPLKPPSPSSSSSPPPPLPSSPTPTLPERRADWLGPLVGIFFALFFGLAAYVALVGEADLPEFLRTLLFSQ